METIQELVKIIRRIKMKPVKTENEIVVMGNKSIDLIRVYCKSPVILRKLPGMKRNCHYAVVVLLKIQDQDIEEQAKQLFDEFGDKLDPDSKMLLQKNQTLKAPP